MKYQLPTINSALDSTFNSSLDSTFNKKLNLGYRWTDGRTTDLRMYGQPERSMSLASGGRSDIINKNPNCMLNLYGKGKLKFVQMVSHMTMMTAMPIYSKNL